MTALGLMKGHLMVAKELMAEGNTEAAIPHIEHPVAELYAEIAEQLPERNVEGFDTELNQLEERAKANPEDEETSQALEDVMTTIDEAIAALPEEQRQSPEFVFNVMNNLLRTAAEEYEASIVDGQFVEAIEYQDSRGFVYYAEDLFETISGQVENAENVSSLFEELKTAWPTPIPPEEPVKTPSEVFGLIAEIELQR